MSLQEQEAVLAQVEEAGWGKRNASPIACPQEHLLSVAVPAATREAGELESESEDPLE